MAGGVGYETMKFSSAAVSGWYPLTVLPALGAALTSWISSSLCQESPRFPAGGPQLPLPGAQADMHPGQRATLFLSTCITRAAEGYR